MPRSNYIFKIMVGGAGCVGKTTLLHRYIFFDLTRLVTVNQVKDWVDMIRANASPNISIILGGTKLDLSMPEMIDVVNEHASNLVYDLGLANCAIQLHRRSSLAASGSIKCG